MTQNEISSALCDMYDIRNTLPNKVKNQPKDNDGTETTIGDCLDSVIEFLEEMEKQRRSKMFNQKIITKEQVEWWIGSDHLSPDALLNLLTELANGEYTIPNFRADVLEFSEDTNHA